MAGQSTWFAAALTGVECSSCGSLELKYRPSIFAVLVQSEDLRDVYNRFSLVLSIYSMRVAVRVFKNYCEVTHKRAHAPLSIIATIINRVRQRLCDKIIYLDEHYLD